MTNTIFYLSTCDTCRRILKEIKAEQHGFALQDIKTSPLTAKQVDTLKEMAGSYEALFDPAGDALFYNTRLVTARFFAEAILPQVYGLSAPVMGGNAAVSQIANDQF